MNKSLSLMRFDPATEKEILHTMMRKSAAQHNENSSSKVYPSFIKPLAHAAVINPNSQETRVILRNLKVVKLVLNLILSKVFNLLAQGMVASPSVPC